MAKLLVATRRIANSFGAVGYSLLAFIYAVILGGIILSLINGGQLSKIGIEPVGETMYSQELEADEPQKTNIFAMIFAYIFAAISVISAVFIFVTFPYWLGRGGSYFLKRLIRLFQQQVTLLSLLIAKATACLVPVFFAATLVLFDISNLALSSIAVSLASMAGLVFLIQHYLAKSDGLEARDIW